MTETLKTLGQAAPAINTLTTLYTVPAATQASCSTIVICNQDVVSIKFRISVAVAGAADTPKQYLYYDAVLPKNSSIFATIGITLGATDVVRCQSDTANVSFNLFGVEES